MDRKLLINAAEEEECRIAIVSNGKLEFIERTLTLREQYKGNIYKGKIARIEPSLQAAFVEFSHSHRAGFLPMGEIMPELYLNDNSNGDDENSRRPRIENIVKRGQEVIVQVVKEETGSKGSALSTFVSLAGRYLVLMPGNSTGGISRKIENDEQRVKLKNIINDLKFPDNVGVIVRTAGMGKTKTDIGKDLQAQLRLWKEISKRGDESPALTLLHQEQDVLIRTLRDNFTSDITEILCDTKFAYEQAHQYLKAGMPRYVGRVKYYEDSAPIFNHFKIEEQIEQLNSNRVNLPSGGWIVLEQTEAMVCVDVNSGKATQEKGIEKTAFRTNVEAAEEVARQLRLRDLGGLVVIDFIDMKDSKHLRKVEKVLKDSMKMDRARHELGRVSKFCIMELSRQRLKSRNHSTHFQCPRCLGTGSIQTPESEALSVLRMLHGHASRGTVSAIRVSTPIRVARYLLNQKRLKLSQLEHAYACAINVIPDPTIESICQAASPDLSRRSAPPAGIYPRPLSTIVDIIESDEDGITLLTEVTETTETAEISTIEPTPTRSTESRVFIRPREERDNRRNSPVSANKTEDKSRNNQPEEQENGDKKDDSGTKPRYTHVYHRPPAADLPRYIREVTTFPIDNLPEPTVIPEEIVKFATITPDLSDYENCNKPQVHPHHKPRTSSRPERTEQTDTNVSNDSDRSKREPRESRDDRHGKQEARRSRGRTDIKGKPSQQRDSNGPLREKRPFNKTSAPKGLPRDEDLIHPDDLGSRNKSEESNTPPPPVPEQKPQDFNWNFGFVSKGRTATEKSYSASPYGGFKSSVGANEKGDEAQETRDSNKESRNQSTRDIPDAEPKARPRKRFVKKVATTETSAKTEKEIPAAKNSTENDDKKENAPVKKAVTKKTTAKADSAETTTAKKPATKKTTVKKAPIKKAAAPKKAAEPKKATAKKAAAPKKAPAKKAPVKKKDVKSTTTEANTSEG